MKKKISLVLLLKTPFKLSTYIYRRMDWYDPLQELKGGPIKVEITFLTAVRCSLPRSVRKSLIN